MTVKKILQEYKGQEIKLGAKTSFVFCGKVGDDIESIIDMISNIYFKSLVDYKNWLEEYLDPINFEYKWAERINKAIELEKKKEGKKRTKEEIIKYWLKKKNNAYVYYSKRLPATNKRIENFTPFLERKVIEVYKSIVDKSVTIIRFSGFEQGAFWDKEEYDQFLENTKEATQNEENIVNC